MLHTSMDRVEFTKPRQLCNSRNERQARQCLSREVLFKDRLWKNLVRTGQTAHDQEAKLATNTTLKVKFSETLTDIIDTSLVVEERLPRPTPVKRVLVCMCVLILSD